MSSTWRMMQAWWSTSLRSIVMTFPPRVASAIVVRSITCSRKNNLRPWPLQDQHDGRDLHCDAGQQHRPIAAREIADRTQNSRRQGINDLVQRGGEADDQRERHRGKLPLHDQRREN